MVGVQHTPESLIAKAQGEDSKMKNVRHDDDLTPGVTFAIFRSCLERAEPPLPDSTPTADVRLTQFEAKQNFLDDATRRRMDECYTNEDLTNIVRAVASQRDLADLCNQRLAALTNRLQALADESYWSQPSANAHLRAMLLDVHRTAQLARDIPP